MENIQFQQRVVHLSTVDLQVFETKTSYPFFVIKNMGKALLKEQCNT